LRISKELTISRALVLTVIILSAVFSASISVRPVSAYFVNLQVVPNNVTATSGSDTQTIGFAVSTTYYSCWIVCEATWFTAEGSAPFVDSSLTTTGCSMANYNSFLWSGTCTVTIFLYVNHGGVTPVGTYHPTFFVYSYFPKHLVTTITLTVT
jgi:hypothetical protein